MIRMDRAIEIQENNLKWSKEKHNSTFQYRFRDLAKIYLMLEDIELNTSEYQQYMNISTF